MQLRLFFFKGHLEEGEEIIHIVHKHWFVILSGMMKVFLLGFVIPALLYYIFPLTFFFWLMILWVILAFLKMTYIILNWYLDAWLLTNMAIIDVIWEGFFKRSTQRIEYKSIEQVSYTFSGVTQTLYNYGSLHIQQPGGVTSIEDIDKPKKVASQISQLQEKYMKEQKYSDEEALKDILTGMIKRHIEKNGLNVHINNDS
jgi:uncharacterized membrane protein YdbT with pleckstrin-like domain